MESTRSQRVPPHSSGLWSVRWLPRATSCICCYTKVPTPLDSVPPATPVSASASGAGLKQHMDFMHSARALNDGLMVMAVSTHRLPFSPHDPGLFPHSQWPEAGL